MKAQIASGRKWSCNRCRWDMLRPWEEKLENVLQQTEDLKQKDKGLEVQL
jgi:hypothetical protein